MEQCATMRSMHLPHTTFDTVVARDDFIGVPREHEVHDAVPAEVPDGIGDGVKRRRHRACNSGKSFHQSMHKGAAVLGSIGAVLGQYWGSRTSDRLHGTHFGLLRTVVPTQPIFVVAAGFGDHVPQRLEEGDGEDKRQTDLFRCMGVRLKIPWRGEVKAWLWRGTLEKIIEGKSIVVKEQVVHN